VLGRLTVKFAAADNLQEPYVSVNNVRAHSAPRPNQLGRNRQDSARLGGPSG
jgi:hypothetical protein